MRANLSVHEPKQPQDEESPLAYTMEGDNTGQSGALLPFVWSPGWNSNQSLHKFQSEVGGALAGGTAGARLIDKSQKQADKIAQPQFSSSNQEENKWQLVPLYRIYGSDELSAKSQPVTELVDVPFIQLSSTDANLLGTAAGQIIVVSLPDGDCSMTLQINDSIPAGCAGYSVGLPNAHWLPNDIVATLRLADSGGL